MATITGKAFVVGDDVDTDQIIPAEYLSYDPSKPEERRMFGRFALSGVPAAESGLPDGNIALVDPTDPDHAASAFRVVIAGSNFGCGSSREHAPLALSEAGVQAVVAGSYARIYYRNAVNGGYALPLEFAEPPAEPIRTGDEVEIDLDADTLTDRTTGRSYALRPLGEAAPIVEAGGIFEYARRSGMLKR